MYYPLQPVYSHGGPSSNGYIAVVGTGTTAGRPVFVGGATINPAFSGFYTGTTCTVLLEGNGGVPDQNGNPPSGEWIDYSNGGFVLTNGQNFSKYVPRCIPYWRTRITVNTAPTGAGFYSYCPGIIGRDGVIVSASYPQLDSGTRTS